MFYQALLLLAPALLYFFNRRIARIVLALILTILLGMGMVGYVQLRFDQVVTLVATLLLLIDSEINSEILSLISLTSVIGLPGYLPLFTIIILVFLALSAKGQQGRIGLYAMLAMPVTLLLEFLGYQFAAIPVLIVLLGVPPLHGWLAEIYSSYRSIEILVAISAVLYLYVNRELYLGLLPVLIIIGVIMMLSGVFHGMVSKSLATFSSAIHLVTFGLLLLASQVNEALFIYSLIPSALALIVINSLHEALQRRTGKNGLFDFGGLSTKMKTETASILAAYLTITGIISLGAEVFLSGGLSGDVVLILLGCVTLFTTAASLAVFFRGYTLIFEGLPRGESIISGYNKYPVLALSIIGLLLALIPVLPLGAYAFITAEPIFGFDSLNILLLICLGAVVISLLFSPHSSNIKRRSWTTGYAGMSDLSGSHGEVFTSWTEIFKPFYSIRVPDDKVSAYLERLNPVIILLALVLLTLLGGMI